MNKMYLIPIVTLILLLSLFIFAFYSSSNSFQGNSSFLGNYGSAESEYQIVEVGGYQFKIPNELKFGGENNSNDNGFYSYVKYYSLDGKHPSKKGLDEKGLAISVWKDYAPDLTYLEKYLNDGGFDSQKINLSGYPAYKYTKYGQTFYAISVNGDVITIIIFGDYGGINLVETILKFVFSNSNNKFGENSQSTDTSSKGNNDTDDSASETSNNKKNSDTSSGSSSSGSSNSDVPNEEPLTSYDSSSSDSTSGSTSG
jgi:hypothetical protein